MTASETKEILRLVFGAYPTQRQRMQPEDIKAMLEVWILGLADIPFDVGKNAIGRLVLTSKWMPSIAEVRTSVGEVHHGLKRHGLEAWRDVLKAVGRFGINREDDAMQWLTKSDPAAAYCANALGWRIICMSEESDPAPRARFVDLYDGLAGDARKLGQLAPGGKIPERIAAPEGKQLGDIVKGMLPAGSEP